jgi:hypothetical protein
MYLYTASLIPQNLEFGFLVHFCKSIGSQWQISTLGISVSQCGQKSYIFLSSKESCRFSLVFTYYTSFFPKAKEPDHIYYFHDLSHTLSHEPLIFIFSSGQTLHALHSVSLLLANLWQTVPDSSICPVSTYALISTSGSISIMWSFEIILAYRD